MYRDKENNFVISIEHDTTGNLVMYFNSFINENISNKNNISAGELKNRIKTALNFLKVKHIFE